MMKKFKDWIFSFLFCTWWLWVIVIFGAIAYLISVSDLPIWFKFWLLK